MEGRCLCGGVTITLPRPPEYINMCNCRLCRSLGTACGYYGPDDVSVAGELRGFERGDLGTIWITQHFCPICGSATHWSPTGRAPRDRMGVNMRLFAIEDIAGVEVRYVDGRSVESDEDEFLTLAIGHIGDGRAF